MLRLVCFVICVACYLSFYHEAFADEAQDQLIAAKEKEVIALREQLIAREQELSVLRGKPSLAMPSLQKLFEEIPEDSRPKNGQDFVIERNKANLWAKKNLAGKEIELPLRIDFVNINPGGGENHYDVYLQFQEHSRSGYGERHHGEVQVGDERFFVRLRQLAWSALDEATAKKMRDMKSKTVVIRGKLATPKQGSLFSHNNVTIDLTEATIDGFNPAKP